MSDKNKITWWVGVSILIQSQIGVGILSLSNKIHPVAKGDGWISVILSGMIVQLFITIIWYLMKTNPNKTLFEFAPLIAGKYLGALINISYIFYFLSTLVVITLLFNDVLKRWIFFETPNIVISILILMLSAYIASESLQIIARFFSISVIFVILLILITIPAFSFFDIRYILPVGQAGVTNIIKATHQVNISILGFELFLILMPFIKIKNRKYSFLLVGNIFTTVIYTFVVFTTFVVFSPYEIKLIIEPILYMLKALQFKLLDRMDLFFLSLWSVSVLTTLVIYLYSSALGISTILKKAKHKKVTYLIVIMLLIIIYFLPKDMNSINLLAKIISNLSYIFTAGIPFILLLIASLKRLFRKKEALTND
ncbi:GerAB/ArcD/ProY family transporter [Saliterribacillus persicus]|nr:GerAB/ArcD/ProY family transporter [Saliterribacillus persicus]